MVSGTASYRKSCSVIELPPKDGEASAKKARVKIESSCEAWLHHSARNVVTEQVLESKKRSYV